MECTLRMVITVVIIVMICATVHSVKGLSNYEGNTGNGVGDISENVAKAVNHLLTNTSSETYVTPHGNTTRWLNPTLHSARMENLDSHREKLIKGPEAISPANFTASRGRQVLTGSKSFRGTERNKKIDEGRKMKLKRTVIKIALWLKMVTLGLVLPAVVALSMVQSWKAVTISLLALGLAVILGIKNIVKAVSGGGGHYAIPHDTVHPTWSTDRQYFNRNFKVEPQSTFITTDAKQGLSPHDLAYRKYRSSF